MQTAYEPITYIECRTPGYKARTVLNAQADVTIAFGVDFTTAGEICTMDAVINAGKLFVTCDLEKSYSVIKFFEGGKIVPPTFRFWDIRTLNVAGNSIDTFYKTNPKYTQDAVDQIICQCLSEMLSECDNIEAIYSGGQTGADEAGIKAGLALEIPVIVNAPRGYKLRLIDGQDVYDKQLFKGRFL